jgi:hypothetical protein
VLFGSQKVDVFELLLINRKGLMNLILEGVWNSWLEARLEKFLVEFIRGSDIFQIRNTKKEQNFLQRRAHHVLSK